MTNADGADIEWAVDRIDAIFAYERLDNTDTLRAIHAAVLAGIGTYEEAIAELLLHVLEHETVEGFSYSKAIGLDTTLNMEGCDRGGGQVHGRDRRTRQELLDDIKQTDAIFALSGFEKTDSVRATDAAVLAGVGTYQEAGAELLAYVREHKTSEGFIYSKAMGLTVLTGEKYCTYIHSCFEHRLS